MTNPAFEYLKDALGTHAAEARVITAPDGHYGHAVVSRWPLRDTVLHDVSLEGREPRAAVMATAELSGYPRRHTRLGRFLCKFPGRSARLISRRADKGGQDPPIIKLRQLDALTFSGGGSSDEFGAGILAGWAKAGTRPKFDIVTGISTGSLIAPFAFLGPAYDDKLKQGLHHVKDANIYIKHSILGVLSSASFTSNAPLAKLLDEHITEDMLDQIARESGKGRRLFIGPTNLDADRAVIWDMGAIAASNRLDRLKLFKQVILASTSIPGIFPPVELEVTAAGKTYHEMHVDGGTSNQVFLMSAGLSLREIDQTFHTRLKARLYIIRNGKTTAEPSIVKATLPDIVDQAGLGNPPKRLSAYTPA